MNGPLSLQAKIAYHEDMKMQNLIAALLLLITLGCATSRTYRLGDIQKDFQSAIQRDEALVSKANADFVEKKVLVDSLSRSTDPGTISQLQTRLEEMNTLLPTINRSKGVLSELNGQVSALSNSRKTVGPDDDVYERMGQIVREFDAETQKLNEHLAKYSRASNNLTDVINEKKLFVTLDIGDFQKRIQSSIRETNEFIQTMNDDLMKLEKVLNLTSENEQIGEAQAKFNRLADLAKDYGMQAHRLPELSQKVKDTTLSAAKISSLDPSYPQAQKSFSELEQLQSQLNGFKSEYQKGLNELQTLLKTMKR